MAHQINPHQQKLAEKLTILNDRGIGMLTRIFNIKKVKFLIDGRQLTFERREENRSIFKRYFLFLGMCGNEI